MVWVPSSWGHPRHFSTRFRPAFHLQNFRAIIPAGFRTVRRCAPISVHCALSSSKSLDIHPNFGHWIKTLAWKVRREVVESTPSGYLKGDNSSWVLGQVIDDWLLGGPLASKSFSGVPEDRHPILCPGTTVFPRRAIISAVPLEHVSVKPARLKALVPCGVAVSAGDVETQTQVSRVN